jgi:hypothetical protein
LAQFQTKADPMVDLQNQILEARKAGEYDRASDLSFQLQAQQAVNTLQAAAAIGSLNTFNQALQNPNLSDGAKQIIKEAVFEGGDPKRGLRIDRLPDILAMGIKPGAFEEFVATSEERALGRSVKSGDYDKTYQQKQKMKEEEMKRQQSITGSGGGTPPAPLLQEKVKELEKKVIDDILDAKFAPV